jgi:hypothetical protein
MDFRLNKKLMKIRITFLSLLAVSAAMVASAQVVEYDDMYFNSKDRARVQASKPLTLKNINTAHEVATTINPTDSYSARNVNPEYISQSTVNPSGSVEKAPYFIPDYTPTAINQNLNSNSSSNWNNCNCASSVNPSYGMMPGYGGYGSPYNSFYPSMSGMYGYNPYGYGGYNGFNSGWSSMLSIGLGMGMGSYYPYGGMGMGSPYLNYGMNYYGGYNSYYPNNVMVINNDRYNNNVAYGKRPSRSSDLNNTVNSHNRSTTMISSDSQGRVRSSSGRIAGDADTNSSSYYQRGWRSNPETNSAARTSTWSNSGRTGSESGRSNSDFTYNNSGSNRSDSNSSFNNNSSRTSSFGGGNSSSNFSSGGSSRSSGSGGGSSGSSRGRD